MRLLVVEAFLNHYAGILAFLEAIVNDQSETGKSRGKLDPIYMVLSLNYSNLRVMQRFLQIVHPIDVQSQGRKATPGEVSSWVNTLILTLTAEGHSKDESVKMVIIQELGLDLPQLPRTNNIAGSCDTVGAALKCTEEPIRTFYKDLLRDRYSKNDLVVVELLRKLPRGQLHGRLLS